MPRIVIENLVEESFESAVPRRTRHRMARHTTRRPRCSRKSPPEPNRDTSPPCGWRPFFPRPPPSFGGWRREQKRDDLAINANWLVDRPTHPPPPTGTAKEMTR